jgi:hypothetical protein
MKKQHSTPFNLRGEFNTAQVALLANDLFLQGEA